jgi:hypothetical protein
LGGAELGDRRTIRQNPPSILITNVTMLEYLLLRAEDQPILERSQGLLRWIALDEAHDYIGAKAAEMALLLRRVRAAFGVEPEQVRLIATSATISEGGKKETEEKLRRFLADLAGVGQEQVRVIEGREAEPELPPAGADIPLDPSLLAGLPPQDFWERLAPHPRVQLLKTKMKVRGLRLTDLSDLLFGSQGNHKTRRKLSSMLPRRRKIRRNKSRKGSSAFFPGAPISFSARKAEFGRASILPARIAIQNSSAKRRSGVSAPSGWPRGIAASAAPRHLRFWPARNAVPSILSPGVNRGR